MSENKLEDSAKAKDEDGKIVDDPTKKKEGDDYVPDPSLEIKTEPKVVEIEDEVLFSHLSKKMGKEIKSFEDLTTEKTVEVQIEFASEQVKEINNYVKKTGRSVNDWHKTQSVDFTKYSSEQLVKENLRSELPDLSGKDIDDYFDNEYRLNSENFEPKEISAAKVKLEMKAKKIRDDALELQARFKVPIKKEETKLKSTESTIQKKTIPTIEKIDNSEKKKVWVDDMKQSVESLEIINVGEFEIKIDDTVKQSIVDANSNLETFFVDNFVKDGKWDYKKLSTIMFLAKEENLNSVIGNIKSNLIGIGTEKVIENRKNLSLPGLGAKKSKELTPELQKEVDDFKTAIVSSQN